MYCIRSWIRSPGQSITVGGITYFSAFDAASGVELWKTDGTAAGTSLIRDLNPGTASSAPAAFVVMGGVIYFTATDGLHGTETVSETVCFEVGMHEIRVEFFEKDGGQVLDVEWNTPGPGNSTTIPAEALFH